MAFFSIIVPVYKVEKYLEQCVESVLAQSCEDYELILVDDGSPDSCPQICDNYEQKYSCIRAIHKKNGGLSDARNTGLQVAQGQFVMFLDSDDFWDDVDCLKKIKACLAEEQNDVLVFGMKKFYQKENQYGEARIPILSEVHKSGGDVVKSLMEHNFFVACACDKVIRRALIEENKMMFVVGQLSEDIEWCSKLLCLNPRIGVISECFYVYRQQNASSISANIGRKNLEHIYTVIEKYTHLGKCEGNEELLNFMSEQYVLWMTVSNLVSYKEIRDLLGKMKQMWGLIRYDRYPYVRVLGKFRFLGFDLCRYLLGLYSRVK